MKTAWLIVSCPLVLSCASANQEAAEPPATELGESEQALFDELFQSFELVSGKCSFGVESTRVNRSDAATCRVKLVAAQGSDVATEQAVAALGELPNLEIVRVEANASSASTPIGQVFHPATSNLFAPLEQAVSGQRFFQVRATDCTDNARFSALALNDAGFLGLNIQYAFGLKDIRVSYARPLPPGLSEEDVRHEVLREQAVFRGMVERPTFDILHPFQERPLLVTVFDLLPVERDRDRCAP